MGSSTREIHGCTLGEHTEYGLFNKGDTWMHTWEAYSTEVWAPKKGRYTDAHIVNIQEYGLLNK
jgi:hypothetical protein